jgi:CheY-like chemotaxis protein
MSLILVVEPDSRHATQLASMARNHLHAELVMAQSGDLALAALADRVPDIVLTAPLLPHRDETVLSDYLRALGDAGAHVQTLTIPILSLPAAAPRGIRGRFRRERPDEGVPEGCDPALFAEQVGQYLRRARQCQTKGVGTHFETRNESRPLSEDVDLTPYLAELSEPAMPAVLADPPAPVVPAEPAPQAVLTPEIVPAEILPADVVPVEVVPAELVPAPAPVSFSRARSRADMLPAVAPKVPVHHPGNLQQVITVPASDSQRQTSVNVAVAVSVQVAGQAAPGLDAPARKSKAPKPIQDEWGFFDPDQCGFRALLARLDAIAATEDIE